MREIEDHGDHLEFCAGFPEQFDLSFARRVAQRIVRGAHHGPGYGLNPAEGAEARSQQLWEAVEAHAERSRGEPTIVILRQQVSGSIFNHDPPIGYFADAGDRSIFQSEFRYYSIRSEEHTSE